MIRKSDDGARVEAEVQVDAAADAVWKAITDPQDVRCWFALDARGDAGTVDGLLEITWGEDAWWGLRASRADPPRHLTLRDAQPPAEGQPLLSIDIHLEGDGGSTAVRLVHSGFGPDAQWNDYLEGLDAGWGCFLRNLKVFLEHHRDVPRTMAWARATVRGSRETIWGELLGVFGVDPADLASAGGDCPVSLGSVRHAGHLEAAVPGRTLAVRVPDLDQSLLFLEIESGGDEGRVGIWLSTYGMGEGEVSRLQEAVDAAARELTHRLVPS